MSKASWRASALSVAAMLALQACGGGGGDSSPAPTPSQVPDGGSVNPSNTAPVPSTQGSTAASLSVAAGGTVSLAASSAQVVLPAAGLVYADNTAATSTVLVTLQAIDPALAPQSMPSTSYLAAALGADGQPQLLESFGAIEVTLNDAAGKPLKLATGQKATVRIPVRTRSANTPATLDLHHWDTTVQKWVKDGTATLNATGDFYEGQVSHFTTWSANLPAEAVTVSGCVRNADGSTPAAGAVSVATDGIDYSGLVTVANDASGQFSVRMKRGGHATLVLTDAATGGQATADLDAVADDRQLGSCLKLPAKANDQEALFALLRPLYETFTFALAPAAVVDLRTGDARLMPADQVCSNGKLTQLLLDEQPGVADALLSNGQARTLAVGFQGCALRQTALGGFASAYGPSVLLGDARSSFTDRSAAATGVSVQASTDVSGLLDLTARLGSSGRYGVSHSVSANGQTASTLITPAAGTTLHKLLSGRSLSFVGGSLQRSGTELTFNQLSFTLAGATYVVNGSVNNATGGDLTVSRNGVAMGGIAGNQVNTAKGQRVDAF